MALFILWLGITMALALLGASTNICLLWPYLGITSIFKYFSLEAKNAVYDMRQQWESAQKTGSELTCIIFWTFVWFAWTGIAIFLLTLATMTIKMLAEIG